MLHVDVSKEFLCIAKYLLALLARVKMAMPGVLLIGMRYDVRR